MRRGARFRRIAWAASFFLLPNIITAADDDTVGKSKFESEIRFESTKTSDRITVTAKLNEKPIRLVLDTGTTFGVCLFSSKIKALDLKIVHEAEKGESIPGRTNVAVAEPCVFQFGGQTFGDVSIAVFPVPAWISLEDEPEGILGWPMIRQMILGLDLARSNAGVITTLPDGAKSQGNFSIMDDSDDLSLVFVNGKPEYPRIIVDTGSPDGVMLAPKQWSEWKANHPLAPKTLESHFMVGQPLEAREVDWAEEIMIGDLKFRNVPIQEADPAYTRNARPGEDIVAIGLAALKRIVLILDGKNKMAYASPSDAPTPPYRHNRIGVVFIPKNDTDDDRVAHVLPGGPAAKTGMENGDVLLKINTVDVTGWRTDPKVLDDAGNWTNDPAGTQYTFTVRRGTKPLEVKVTSQDLLIPEPDFASDYDKRAFTRYRKKDYDGAIHDWSRAIDLKPDFPEAYNNRGSAWYLKDNLDQAISDCTHAIKLKPDYPEAYRTRGAAKNEKGDYDGAIEDYSQAIALKAEYADAYANRGTVFRNKGDFKQAIADCTRAIELNPDCRPAYRNRLRALADVGEYEKALLDCDKCISMLPSASEYTRFQRTLLLRRLGRSQEDDLKFQLDRWKDGWSRTVGYYLAGKIDDSAFLAQAKLGKDKAVRGQLCEAHYYIGMVQLLAGQIKRARNHFEDCVATDAKNFEEYSLASDELKRMRGSGG